MRQRQERSDAQANRARILAAARAVYAEHGAGAPFSQIAARAGVSRTTVSRHFALRRDLDLAMLNDNVERIEAFGTTVLGRDDGLSTVFRYVVQLQAETTAFHTLTMPDDDEMVTDLFGRAIAVFRQVEASTDESQLAVGATIDDLVVAVQLSAALAGALPAQLDRAWALLERSLFAGRGVGSTIA